MFYFKALFMKNFHEIYQTTENILFRFIQTPNNISFLRKVIIFRKPFYMQTNGKENKLLGGTLVLPHLLNQPTTNAIKMDQAKLKSF